MTNAAFIALGISMAAVLAALVAGVVVMAKGGDKDKKYSNKLMQARVYLQGLALLILLLLAVLAAGSS